MSFLGVLDASKATAGKPLPSSMSFALFKPTNNPCPFIRIPFGALPDEFKRDVSGIFCIMCILCCLVYRCVLWVVFEGGLLSM